MIGTAGASLGKWSRRIQANDTDPALIVDQLGTGLILDLRDGGTSRFQIADSGAITLGSGATVNLVQNPILFDTVAGAGARIQDGGAEIAALRDSTNTRGINITLSAAGNQTIAASAGNLVLTSPFVLDNALFLQGTDGDNVRVHRSATLVADTALASVLLGTTAGSRQALAANSLIQSNITASGDIGVYVNVAGVSKEAILVDSSAATIYLGFGSFSALTYSAPNSTNNTTFTVANTSNAAAASHAIVDIAVGGTTSTGDPQLRLTVPSGTSWYVGVDNSDSDKLSIGTGTAVGTNNFLTVSTAGIVTYRVNSSILAITPTDTSSLPSTLVTLSTTNATALTFTIGGMGVANNNAGKNFTVTAGSGGSSTTGAVGGNVALTAGAAGGTDPNIGGLIVLTPGASTSTGAPATVRIMQAVGSDNTIAAVANAVLLWTPDIAGGDARLAIQSEAGGIIYLGSDRLWFAAATGIVGIGATDVLTLTTATLTLVDAFDIVLNTITGTKIGTGATQKLGFWGAVPVVQAATTAAAPAGGTGDAAGAWSSAANRDIAIATINDMRTALINAGIMAAA